MRAFFLFFAQLPTTDVEREMFYCGRVKVIKGKINRRYSRVIFLFSANFSIVWRGMSRAGSVAKIITSIII